MLSNASCGGKQRAKLLVTQIGPARHRLNLFQDSTEGEAR